MRFGGNLLVTPPSLSTPIMARQLPSQSGRQVAVDHHPDIRTQPGDFIDIRVIERRRLHRGPGRGRGRMG